MESYCKDVEPGEGRVHQCLRFNKDKLTDKCRNEEMKLAAVEYRDIRLRPKLNKLCSEEKVVYCKDIKPGKARVIKCLMENMAQPNFGEECKEELQKREDVMKTDYRWGTCQPSRPMILHQFLSMASHFTLVSPCCLCPGMMQGWLPTARATLTSSAPRPRTSSGAMPKS